METESQTNATTPAPFKAPTKPRLGAPASEWADYNAAFTAAAIAAKKDEANAEK